MNPLTPRQRMLGACRGEPVDRAPVWLMRQAGRYLPEYRAIRAGTSFLERSSDPELAAEISLHPYRRFGVDAVVVFSDILVPLISAGIDLSFSPGPVVGNPIRSATDLARLDASCAEPVGPTCEAIRRIKRELGPDVPVIGFSGAPWTLAAYALEEKLSRDVVALCTLSYQDPALCKRLLERMARISAEALRLQIDAGADVLQIFDTWAGMLDVPRFRELAGWALEQVLAQLPAERPPVIVYARGATHLAHELAALGAEVVSLDWRTDLADAAAEIGDRVSLQGNLDPAALALPPAEIARRVEGLLDAGRKARGHVLNLGHGVQPGTPVEGVAAFVEAGQRPRR